MKILYLDTETTGLDFKVHGICQLAAIMEVNGEVVGEFETLICPAPECVIEDDALAVSGLTRLQLSAAPAEVPAWSAFTKFLSQFINKRDKYDKAFMAGYNAYFDDAFLRAFADRVGDRYLGSWKWPDLLDVRCFAALTLAEKRMDMENFKLGTVAKTILTEDELAEAVGFGDLHDALTDIRITRAVFRKIQGARA